MRAEVLKADGRKKLIHTAGITQDIIDVILKVNSEPINEQTKKLATNFEPTRESMHKLWAFIKENIKYKEDPSGVQWIKTPARLWKDKIGDCKSFTLFAASIFQNLGLDYIIRFTAYEGSEFTHVYPLVFIDKQAIIMDSVWTHFDSEKRFSKKKDYIFKYDKNI